MRIHLLLCLAFFVGTSIASAQQCATQVAVNAFDSRTKSFLYGLTPADFQASIGPAPLDIAAVKPVFRNRVLVLLDAGSNPASESLKQIAQLVEDAPPGMPVAFGIFARRAVFTDGFIRTPDLLHTAIDRVIARAETLKPGDSLARSLHHALGLFGPRQPGDTILLVTSGAEHESQRSMRELKKEFHRRGTRLQLLMGLWPSPAAAHTEVAQLFSGWDAAERFSNQLVRLANSTGGVLMGFMNEDWLHAASSGYMLSVREPAGMNKPQRWILQIRDAGNDVPPADLFYPDQLTPCSAPLVAGLPGKRKPRP
jgi:hypothetical protein